MSSSVSDNTDIRNNRMDQFQKFVSPAVADHIINGKIDIKREFEIRYVTILFADICGFSRLSQSRPAMEVAVILNTFFEISSDVVFRHGGTVDKFIGDEIMVVFSVPTIIEDGPLRAVRCALDMQRAMNEVNAKFNTDGKPLQIGIGINSGNAAIGFIGSSRSTQYTCIGNVVNVASRLTDMAKPGRVIISDNILNQIDAHDDMIFEQVPTEHVNNMDPNVSAFSIRANGKKDVKTD